MSLCVCVMSLCVCVMSLCVCATSLCVCVTSLCVCVMSLCVCVMSLCVCAMSLCVCATSLCVCVTSLCVCGMSLCVCVMSLCVCAMSLCVCVMSLCVCGMSLCVCITSLCVCVTSLCVCVMSLCVCVTTLCVCVMSLCVCAMSLVFVSCHFVFVSRPFAFVSCPFRICRVFISSYNYNRYTKEKVLLWNANAPSGHKIQNGLDLGLLTCRAIGVSYTLVPMKSMWLSFLLSYRLHKLWEQHIAYRPIDEYKAICSRLLRKGYEYHTFQTGWVVIFVQATTCMCCFSFLPRMSYLPMYIVRSRPSLYCRSTQSNFSLFYFFPLF